MPSLSGPGTSQYKTAQSAKTVSTNPAYNAKPTKPTKLMDVPSHGVPATTHIIPIALINGRTRKKLNAPSAKIFGIPLKQRRSDCDMRYSLSISNM
jgi:hypothetical protein